LPICDFDREEPENTHTHTHKQNGFRVLWLLKKFTRRELKSFC
jgi:hypothetical protein